MLDFPDRVGVGDLMKDVHLLNSTDRQERWMADDAHKQENKGRRARGPIFEDGPNVDTMFRLFHGRDGVVPLTDGQYSGPASTSAAKLNPIGTCAAPIGWSVGSRLGPFNSDSFTARNASNPVSRKQSSKRQDLKSTSPFNGQSGSEWLSTGNCPVARSYRAFGVGGILPTVAKANEAGGPIFEDGSNFDVMFRLFHGRDGLLPLAEGQYGGTSTFAAVPTVAAKSSSLAACAASISLSFGSGMGPFSFDSLMAGNVSKPAGRKQKPKKKEPTSESQSNVQQHEMGSEWLTTGNCPIARSYRAVGGLLPLVAKVLTPPKNMKYVCPPAIVAARKALAKTSAVKALRPQALPTKVLAIGCLGMMLNIPLGMYREHTVKFSPQWILAVHATVPFIAMLRKAVVMPKYAMAFTIGSAILGQAIGARAERARLLESSNTFDKTKQGCAEELWKSSSGASTTGTKTLPPALAAC